MENHFRTLLLSLVVILLLVSCTVSTTSPSTVGKLLPTRALETEAPAVPKSRLQLTFASERDGKHGVYAVDVLFQDEEEINIGKPQLLFEWHERIYINDWSPDGKRIAFESGLGGNLFIADWNGENPSPITTQISSTYSAQWSPDSSKIAYIFRPAVPETEMLGPAEIRLFDLPTGVSEHIFPDIYDPSRVYWLPNGKFAINAQVSPENYSRTVKIVDATGKVEQQIPETVDEYDDIFDVDFSIDFIRMAISTDMYYSGISTLDIFVFDLHTGKSFNLTNGFGGSIRPTWAPSVDWIAYQSDFSENYDIYLVRPDGSGMIKVTDNPADDSTPTWRILTP